MADNDKNDEFLDNKDRKRFELKTQGITAFVDYIINKKGVIYLTHTEVPEEAEGQGIATRLIDHVMEEIKERELELVPICPFVKVYLQRNPKYKELLADHAQF